MSDLLQIIQGDCRETLKTLPDESVQCCVTSPAYWGLRDYGHPDQIGQEATPQEFVAEMVTVFAEVHRVLREDGTLWLNLGDSYNAAGREGHGTRIGFKQGTNRASANGHDRNRTTDPALKPKDLVGIPWRVAFALQADGWYLRSDIIWSKPNPMPESVTDRPTKAHEYIFLLTKSERYFYDAKAIAEPAIHAGESVGGSLSVNGPDEKLISQNAHRGKPYERIAETRNKRSVWTVSTQSYGGAHFATFPTALVKPCIMAGSAPGDTVLDPFGGSGTTGMVAIELGRKAIMCELNPDYVELGKVRCDVTPGLAL